MYLYKYKAGNDNDISALMNDSLWASTYDCLNDPIDLHIYVEAENDDITDEQIDRCIEDFEKMHCCMAFSHAPYAKRLWDYYTNGWSGLVLAYDKKAIEEALCGMKVTYREGKVKYDGEGYRITDTKQLINGLSGIPDDVYFHKTDDWKEEDEYRFVFEYDESKPYFYSPKGFLVSGLVPHHIFIGHKMKKENKEKMKEYCRKKNICLYQISPDRKTKNGKAFRKTTLVSKSGDADNDMYSSVSEMK